MNPVEKSASRLVSNHFIYRYGIEVDFIQFVFLPCIGKSRERGREKQMLPQGKV